MGLSDGRKRNNGALACLTERDVRVLAQLRDVGVSRIEIGGFCVSFGDETRADYRAVNGAAHSAPSPSPATVLGAMSGGGGGGGGGGDDDDDEPSAYDSSGYEVTGGGDDAH